MSLTMFDTDQNSQFPAGGDAYAAYVDGGLADQPNYAYIVAAFPKAFHLSIALYASDDADCVDMERGAAAYGDFPGWQARQRARGVTRPCGYASASAMESYVLPAMQAAGIDRASVRLWSAHYGAGEHICGPGTCGLVSIDMDGTQWTDAADSRTVDQSLLLDTFFGTLNWEDTLLASIPVIKRGSTGLAVRNWQGILVAHGYDLGTTGKFKDGVDGVFGLLTDQETRAFQKAKGIAEDGIVGKDTYTAALTA